MKITNLKLSEHKLFTDTDILLSDGMQKGNVKTVIIGPNGAGKSTLLSCICDIFLCELSTTYIKKKKNVSAIDYKYEVLTDMEVISNQNDNSSFIRKKVLAVTNSYKDKFYYPTKNGIKNSPDYIYLGLRSASNNIFFSNVNDDMLKYLISITLDSTKIKAAIKILNELHFQTSFSIVLKKGKNYKKFLESDINHTSLSDGSLNRFLSSEYYLENEKKVFSTLAYFNDERYSKLDFDLKSNTFDTPTYQLESLLQLVNARILSVDRLSLFSHEGYDINEASSGEFNILRVMLSVISNIENDSLILIDEPEISLHPNWQIEFCRLLDLAIEDFTGCHTIIATHSHFILSNLSQLSSTIVSMQLSTLNRKVYLQNVSLESFGMSPENTLYTFFGITGYNNKYFEEDLRILFGYISNDKSVRFDRFEKSFLRLNEFNFDQSNPIVNALRAAEKLIAKEKS